MLSAENVALENRAIRLMLQIREKELNYITNKYNAMGTQAALVGGEGGLCVMRVMYRGLGARGVKASGGGVEWRK